MNMPMVFLDGAVPGVTQHCAGAPLWGAVLDRFRQEAEVSVLEWAAVVEHGAEPVEFDGALAQVAAALRARKSTPCHLVGHDLGGLAALHLAWTAPGLVGAVTVCSSAAVCPTGDGVENLTLAYPPGAPGSRSVQRWALERLSYSHLHIDDALLDACEATARSPVWQRAAMQLQDAGASARWSGSVSRAKARFFEVARGAGVPVPVQLVWGTHDPLAPMEQALWAYRIVAQTQPRTQFHAINRTGAFPFREDALAFHQVLGAFRDGLAAEA